MGCSQSTPSAKPGGSTGKSAPEDKDKDKRLAKEENVEYQQWLKFLSQVQLFKFLPKDHYPLLAGACEACEFKSGQVIIKQGDTGNEFYVIRDGEAAVTVIVNSEPSKQVAMLKTGDYFGEKALLRDEPRTATITAHTNLSTLKISRDKFQQLGLNEKLVFANRKAVGGGGAGRNVEAKAPSPKNPQERELIAAALAKNESMQTLVNLNETRVNQMIDVAWKEEIEEGKEVITEGDLNADYFYIVQEGQFEVFAMQEDNTGKSAENSIKKGESKHVATCVKGDCFGELALLYLVPRAATVKAKVHSVVWVIDRKNFKDILLKVSADRIAEYVKFLDRVDILAPLLAEERKAIAQALVEMHFTKNEIILQQGEPGNTFYILYDGEVSVVKDGKEQIRLTANPQRKTAEVFGERALLQNEPRAATVMVTSTTAKALALDRDAFNLLLGPLEELIKRNHEGKSGTGEKPSKKKHQGANPSDKKSGEKILRKDLVKIGLLGCGGFGSVELFEHRKSGNTYAMKALSKGYVVKTGMQESVMNEKIILMMTNSPFIIKLWECFNGAQSLYFLLEPALGGELYATYNRKGFHGSEKHAKFYVAGVVYAFEHLHERHIIYRDLKPENLLLNELGQIKLTDMGLAKFVIGKTYTTCGTPDYFAPELITSSGHTNAVDWWTLGILTFELMSGAPPFESAYPMQIYAKVMKGINKVNFPPKCQGPVGDLIKLLLKKEPSERLPMRPGGAANLRNQKWYTGFDWDSMKNLTMEAPYKPVVKSKKDIANFSARKEDMPKAIEYRDDHSGWDKDFAT